IWCSFAAFSVLMAIVFVISSFENPDTDADGNPIGHLLPANDPMPRIVDREIEEMIAQHNISSPTNRIFLLMGSNFIMLDGTNYLPVVRFHEKDMVSISIGPMGASVSGEFFDKNNNVFAVMQSNRFILNIL